MRGLIICRAPASVDRRRIIKCPTEGRRRRFVVSYGGWWGVTYVCCGCGDAWNDGERLERPFAPRWREQSVKRAKARYAAAMAGPAPSLREQGVIPMSDRT